MQTRQLLLHIKDENIQAVAKIFKNTYPVGLEESLSFSVAQASTTSLAQNALQQGMQHATTAVITSAGGISGGLAYTAVNGIQQFLGALFDPTKDLTRYKKVALDYLSFKKFQKNENLNDAEFELYKNLYFMALEYQRLKETRFDLTSTHSKTVINDVKYFTVILIGHILERMLTANSKETAQLQKEHLQNFIHDIISLNCVTDTQSTDKNFLSLRSLLLSIDQKLKKQTGPVNGQMDWSEQHKALMEHIRRITGHTMELIRNTKIHLQNCITVYTEEMNSCHTARQSAPALAQPTHTKSLFETWMDFLEQDVELSDDQLKQFFSKTTKIENSDLVSSSLEKIKEVIASLKAIQHTRSLIHKIQKLDELSGLMGVHFITHEIIILNRQLERQAKTLIDVMEKLNSFFEEVYKKSSDSFYRNRLSVALVQYNSSKEVDLIEETRPASYLAAQINIRKEDIEKNIVNDARNLITELQTHCGTKSAFTPTLPSSSASTSDSPEDDWEIIDCETDDFETKPLKIQMENNQFKFNLFFKNDALEKEKATVQRIIAEKVTLEEKMAALEEQSKKDLVEIQKKNKETLEAIQDNHHKQLEPLKKSKNQHAREKTKKYITRLVNRFGTFIRNYYFEKKNPVQLDLKRHQFIVTKFEKDIYAGLRTHSGTAGVGTFSLFREDLDLANSLRILQENYLKFLQEISQEKIMKDLDSYKENGLRHHLYSYLQFFEETLSCVNTSAMIQNLKLCDNKLGLIKPFDAMIWHNALSSSSSSSTPVYRGSVNSKT